MQGGGGSPEQSQRVVFGYQLDENYSQTSARRGRPRSYAQARALAFNAKGEKPAEPVLSKQSELADDVKSNAKGEKPAEPVPYLVPSDWTTKNRRVKAEPATERHPQCDPSKILAFTMAEILLSLTIIGVVAAITLPSLTGNINERTWNTQRKALYARFSQALPLMDALNGYGTLKEMTDSATGSTSIEDTAAETFVTSGLSKVIKINNICDNEHLEDCGITSKITTLNGSQIDMPTTMQELNDKMVGSYSNTHDKFSLLDTKAAAFETQNGESITVFYNPHCIGSLNEMPAGLGGGFYMQPKVCANFIYDLNGNKGPNTVGKDIGFMTALYPFDAILVAPYPAVRALDGTYYLSTDSGVSASQACTDYDSEYRLPNADELASMFVNKNLLASNLTGTYWSSTTFSAAGAWAMYMTYGQRDDFGKATQLNVWCVKR